jgi:hypothetical protein
MPYSDYRYLSKILNLIYYIVSAGIMLVGGTGFLKIAPSIYCPLAVNPDIMQDHRFAYGKPPP